MPSVIFPNFVNLYDVWMLDARDRLGLDLKTPAVLHARENAVADHLDRDHAVEPELSCPEHHSHPAAAQLLVNLVARNVDRRLRRVGWILHRRVVPQSAVRNGLGHGPAHWTGDGAQIGGGALANGQLPVMAVRTIKALMHVGKRPRSFFSRHNCKRTKAGSKEGAGLQGPI